MFRRSRTLLGHLLHEGYTISMSDELKAEKDEHASRVRAKQARYGKPSPAKKAFRRK